jgi:soluble lytic murein transglycosylase-like protein
MAGKKRGALWFATGPLFQAEVASVRLWLGGSAEARRQGLAHQVYAAYRRADPDALLRVLERARVYEPTVHEAAAAFGVDPEVLMGVGAAESAFYPRDSADGGRGLFQITTPPAAAVTETERQLRVDHLDPLNQRHNAFVAAATLRGYLDEMGGDVFLALLAFNIGPRNGGLRAIMTQYGARDFVTIQPYLQHLPRDYPIRVLSAALAYRLWRSEGRLPRYEDGDNALHIQSVGIPGLSAAKS